MAAKILGAVGLALLAYHAVTSRADPPHSNALLAVSAGLWAATTLLYGVGRPFTKVSVSTAAAFVLVAMTYLLPGEFGGWKRVAAEVFLAACTIAWLRWVVFPKGRNTHVSKNRSQRRHPSRG